MANGIFAARFLVQWYATERKGQVTIPLTFWWLSLAGSFLMLAYALCYNQDLVFIFSNAFNWIPYLRNVIIHHRHKAAHRDCAQCGAACPPVAKFCSQCGTRVEEVESSKLKAQSPK
ncbi:MAG: lipid-A-disaccharide synthase N-terminal domain-containing protein [Verrucomicrobia bacterium]|nr:lipid-A-disaccharide synthase N-terminal domain-containing protein [Verrucomicrobiota bacterium]